MGPFEFTDQINRLKDCFGAKFYNEVRKDMIFEIAKDLPDPIFKKMVNFFIDTQRIPPTPNDFRKSAYQYRSTIPKYQADAESKAFSAKVNCGDCNDFGFLVVCAKEWLASDSLLSCCHCFAGQEASSANKLPKWQMSWASEWNKRCLDSKWFGPAESSLGPDPRMHKKVIEWSARKKESELRWGPYFDGLNKAKDEVHRVTLTSAIKNHAPGVRSASS